MEHFPSQCFDLKHTFGLPPYYFVGILVDTRSLSNGARQHTLLINDENSLFKCSPSIFAAGENYRGAAQTLGISI